MAACPTMTFAREVDYDHMGQASISQPASGLAHVQIREKILIDIRQVAMHLLTNLVKEIRSE